jgi:hypothetical protein
LIYINGDTSRRKTKGRMKTKISRIFGVGVTLSLLASLLVGALPASAAVSSATVAIDDDVISAVGVEYDLVFSITGALNAAADNIVVEFPPGFDIGPLTDAVDADVQVAATSGIGTPAFPLTNCSSQEAGVQATGMTLTIDVPNASGDGLDDIGVGAVIQVIITGITNGPTPGDYVLEINTTGTGDTTQVDSQTFTLVPPTIPPAPGIVTLHNDADIPMDIFTGGTAIMDAVTDAATDSDWLIVIGPGTYVEDVDVGDDGLRFRAEVPGTAVVQGTWSIDEDDILLEGLNIEGTVDIQGGGTDCIIQDCTLSRHAAGGDDLINVDDTGALVTGCTLDVTSTALDNGIDAWEPLDVVGCAFTVGAANNAIETDDVLDVDDCTFAGPGNGLHLLGGSDTTVDGSGFDGLNFAVEMNGDTLDVEGNTFTGCGDATAASLNGVFDINAVGVAGGVTIVNNTFTENEHALVMVNGGAVDSFFKFNTCDLTAGFDNNDGANVLDATNNYWGSADGPTGIVIDQPVQVDPWLPAPITGAFVQTAVAAATNVDGSATVGVEVISTGTMACVGLGNYASNPVPGQPFLADVIRWFEVNVVGLGAVGDDITITLHGITNTLAGAWAWSTYMDMWVNVPAVVDLFTGTVEFTLDNNTSPSNANLNELVFALTEPSAIPPAAVGQGTIIPAQAAQGVDVELTSFSWGAVAGATSYNFQLATYLAGSADPFIPALIVLDVNLETNGIILLTEVLDYLETYAWRVQAVNAAGGGAWTTGFFTTAAEPPEPPADPVWIIEQEPTQIEWPDNITIEVPPITQPEIPEYILWVVVAVGAILVIAVVVLIVRTRRVA